MEVKELLEIISAGGGNVAFAVGCYFMWKVEQRLTELKTTLATFLDIFLKLQKKTDEN